jgi:hypothetical protein
MQKRDEQDTERYFTPLRKADDAFALDCTNLSIEQVADRVIFLAKSTRGTLPSGKIILQLFAINVMREVLYDE